VGVHKLAPEAGMFIKAKVNGVITNLLIDTGAPVTLISTGFFKEMNNMPTLSPSQRIKLNFVTLDFDSVVVHVNFGMLTLQKVKPQYPIYVYISNHGFVQTLKIVDEFQ
jgi:hypothetical protein